MIPLRQRLTKAFCTVRQRSPDSRSPPRFRSQPALALAVAIASRLTPSGRLGLPSRGYAGPDEEVVKCQPCLKTSTDEATKNGNA